MYPEGQYQLPIFFFMLISFCSFCFSSYQDDQFVRTINHQSSGRPTWPHSQPKTTLTRLYHASSPVVSAKIVNVDDFEADGTDDSKAFMEAWEEACSSENKAILVVPRNKIYYLKQITFSGPCKSDLTMKIYGIIKASVHLSDYKEDPRHWLMFQNVNNFRIEGGGTINGNGKIWWRKSCKVNRSLPCKDAPTAVTFNECENLIVSNLRFLNSQKMHLSFQQCINVRALNLMVMAPGNSPNTDGIHVTGTQNIIIKNCVIRTGDDCISIVSGSKNVRATDITCGPGHGISIGSLGGGNSEAFVSNVLVNRARLSGTANGVRIKTWQGGSGFARDITFENVLMHNVSNPIIIDQHYCDQQTPCQEQDSAVQVSNVVYKNIKGTSASEAAIKLDCSKRFPCQQLLFQDVILGRQEDDAAKASCFNVQLYTIGNLSPRCG